MIVRRLRAITRLLLSCPVCPESINLSGTHLDLSGLSSALHPGSHVDRVSPDVIVRLPSTDHPGSHRTMVDPCRRERSDQRSELIITPAVTGPWLIPAGGRGQPRSKMHVKRQPKVKSKRAHQRRLTVNWARQELRTVKRARKRRLVVRLAEDATGSPSRH